MLFEHTVSYCFHAANISVRQPAYQCCRVALLPEGVHPEGRCSGEASTGTDSVRRCARTKRRKVREGYELSKRASAIILGILVAVSLTGCGVSSETSAAGGHQPTPMPDATSHPVASSVAPAPHNAEPTVALVVTALKATDLGALYDLADISLRNGLTREQFVTKLGATGGGGSVTGVNVTGATKYVTTSAGADFALTPITFHYTKAGAHGHVVAHLRLIFTGGQWRYLTTQPDNTPANSDDNTPDPNLP
jgi:hypothetical protein